MKVESKYAVRGCDERVDRRDGRGSACHAPSMTLCDAFVNRRTRRADGIRSLLVGIVLVAMSSGAWAYGNDNVVDPPVDTATANALEMQRSGTHAGPSLAMLGDQASAAYARYLKSFDSPIPVLFGSSLKSDVGSTGGGEGGQ